MTSIKSVYNYSAYNNSWTQHNSTSKANSFTFSRNNPRTL